MSRTNPFSIFSLKSILKNSSGGGAGGTSNYNELSNRPKINGVTLSGDKKADDYNLVNAEKGKGLSTNDFTNEDKAKLDNLADKPYLSLERLADFLYKVTFDTIPAEQPYYNKGVIAGCTSFVKEGKLFRNLDWNYDNTAIFDVVFKNIEGMALLPGLEDGNLNDEDISQLPYHLNDGKNTHGIMVSAHVLYNDFGFSGVKEGGTALTKIPFIVLSNLTSMRDISSLEAILSEIRVNQFLREANYLLQFLVTDGITSNLITPKDDGSGYEIIDISGLPKLANFKWVNKATLERTDKALQLHPNGVKRWNLIEEGASLQDLRYTLAYENNDRLDDFIGIDNTDKNSTDEELQAIYERARAIYLDRQRDGSTWQTCHSVVYSSEKMESLCVQENYTIDYASHSGYDDRELRLKIRDLEKYKEDTSNKKDVVNDNAEEYISGKALTQYFASGNGGYSKDITGQDLNQIVKTGLYHGNSLVNYYKNQSAYLLVISHSTNNQYVTQLLFPDNTKNSMLMAVRKLDNGTWSSWRDIPVFDTNGAGMQYTGDLNNLINTGLYVGYSLTNIPEGANTSQTILVIRHQDSNYLTQVLIGYQGTMYCRGKNNGAWSSWEKIITSEDLATKLDKSNTSNIVYTTDNSGNQSTTELTTEGKAWTIPVRDETGHIYANSPTEDWHTTNKGYVDNLTFIDKLWENPSPGSRFEEQEITLDTSYQMYLITFFADFDGLMKSKITSVLFNTSNSPRYEAIAVRDGNNYSETTRYNTIDKRSYSLTQTGIRFEDAMTFNSSNLNNDGTYNEVNNAKVIPYQIYGIRLPIRDLTK